jgi:hypothetical protein
LLALNVSVVTDANNSSFLKWDVIGKLLADGTSSSSSTSSSTIYGWKSDGTCICSNGTTGVNVACKESLVNQCKKGDSSWCGKKDDDDDGLYKKCD